MLKPGTIVRQDYTIIQDRLDFHSDTRLSIVLFSDMVNGEEVVATCLLTRTYSSVKKKPKNYCYVCYMIYSLDRLSIVKINDLAFYPKNKVHSTGIVVDQNAIQRIFDCIMNYEESDDKKEIYGMVRKFIQNMDFSGELKEERRKRKLERSLRRQVAKKCNS